MSGEIKDWSAIEFAPLTMFQVAKWFVLFEDRLVGKVAIQPNWISFELNEDATFFQLTKINVSTFGTDNDQS